MRVRMAQKIAVAIMVVIMVMKIQLSRHGCSPVLIWVSMLAPLKAESKAKERPVGSQVAPMGGLMGGQVARERARMTSADCVAMGVTGPEIARTRVNVWCVGKKVI